ncbi:MAG: hypothetical protein A2V88_03475 [Elusimicrobia bacterium RBG_16_66_12]|nr:MAG: hypothetical protein A2V88_03475 [Elusimicrobia bacterium RBG_16_66_12]
MTAKRSRLGGLGLWLAAAACVAALAAPIRAQGPKTALDDHLYEIALSSSTPKIYRDRLKRLIKKRENQRAHQLKAKQGRQRGRSDHRRGIGAAARLGGPTVPDPALKHLLRGHGGEVRRADRAAVTVPANALPQNLDVTVSQPDAADELARQTVAANAGKAQASLPVAFGPEGTTFTEPVTITLPYDPVLVASQGLREADLKVHYWDSRQQRWEDLPSTVDWTQGTVSAQTTHFSVYQVLVPWGIGVAAADASFGLKAAYAFPNPVRGQSAVTIRVQPGLSDSVEVHIYDLSGRKIHSSSDFRSVGAFDDGNGQGPQFTYEHTWDVSGISSGIYTYVVTARKAGEQDIRKTGRVGVIK